MEPEQQPEAEDDYGVPFPGEAVAPERRCQAQVMWRRGEPVPWAEWFGRDDAPRVVDLGCGNGRYLLGSALARPERDHLGVDLVPQAVRHAARRAGERGLANLRFAWADAGLLLFQGLQEQGLDEVHVYHPQPYYEAGQVRRRLLTPAFFAQVWRVLRPEGLFVLQTDNPAYWRYLRRAVPRLFHWEEQPEPWPDAPAGRTRREIKARQIGLPVFRALARPRPLSRRRVQGLVRHMPRPDFDANRAAFRPGGRRGPRAE